MLRRLIISLVIIHYCSLSFSQNEFTFYDEFISNKNNWTLTNNIEAYSAISEGKYIAENKSKNGLYFFWKEFNLDIKEDFSFEVKLKQVSGFKDVEVGITWGTSGWDNSNNFTINSNGSYKIWGYKNEKRFEWQGLTFNDNITAQGENNVLTVQKSGNLVKYSINGKSVYMHSFEGFFGNLFGFIVDNQTRVEIESIKLKYPKPVINLVKDINPNLKKKNLGSNLNSKYSEIGPIISPDGQTLYVARQDDPSNFGKQKKYDIWFSTRIDEDSWTKLERMDKPINNDGDNLVIAVSPDNNSLLLEGLYTPSGNFQSDQGISISYRTATGWSVPKQVVIQKYYNKNEFESFCPTSDRKILIMSVERDDAYGSKDLYVSFLLPNGDYSEPFNMGPDINTHLNEGTPFIASDSKTLYFYSYGHPGYGDADIFVTKRLDNSWRSWSKPQNMGPTINSSDWDTYYSISAKGDYAYLVSSRNSLGNEDVFEIKLSEEARPEPVVLIYGRVFNSKSKKPIGVDIVYEDLNSGIKAGDARSNPGNGTYKIILPYGQSYGFRAEAENYMAVNEQIDLSKISTYKEIKRDLYLVPIETGAVINLQNVQFVKSKADFVESSIPELDRLVILMKKYPRMEIELFGHTDTRGNPQLLLQLSQLRVNAVMNYLIQHGINKNRITGRGYGGTKPLGTGSEDIEIKNRRVEFEIKKM